MSQAEFERHIGAVTSAIAGRDLDAALQNELNDRFSATGASFLALATTCRLGIEQGWLCQHEQGGIRYGRVIKPSPASDGFSVDVVLMEDVVGPHHRHPNGEIDLIIPETAEARFDGHGAGWLVYGPDTAHRPTVSEGRAIIVYLLPDGAIEFTGQ